jgi:hypothetical protein
LAGFLFRDQNKTNDLLSFNTYLAESPPPFRWPQGTQEDTLHARTAENITCTSSPIQISLYSLQNTLTPFCFYLKVLAPG